MSTAPPTATCARLSTCTIVRPDSDIRPCCRASGTAICTMAEDRQSLADRALIGRSNTHLIQKGYFLPLIKHYIEGNIPAQDFFWRQWETFHPIGAPTGTCIVVTNTFHNGAPVGNFVIDDFQSNHDSGISSSGGPVTYDVQNLTEGRLDDAKPHVHLDQQRSDERYDARLLGRLR